jgi:uncharacterized protein
MLRAENEGFIKFKVEVDLDEAYDIIDELVFKGDSPATPHVQLAIEEATNSCKSCYIKRSFTGREAKADANSFRFCINLGAVSL